MLRIRIWGLVMLTVFSLTSTARGDDDGSAPPSTTYRDPRLLDLSTFWGREPDPPFEFALVLSGGGFDTAASLGVFDAFVDAGMAPDVIIAPCGASAVAALIEIEPDRGPRKAIALSPQFQRFVSSPVRRSGNRLKALGLLFGIWRRSFGGSDKLPRLYDLQFLDFPPTAVFEPFDTGFDPSGPAAIIVASRTTLTPADRGRRNGDKPFEEVVFTDPETARHLKGFRAPAAVYFPTSALDERVDVEVGMTVWNAVRASIADMYFLEPHQVGDERFLTGGFDFHLELAKGLAERVAITYVKGYSRLVSDPAVHSVYGYSLGERLRMTTGDTADYWVDLSDKREWGEVSFRLREGLPTDYQEYLARARVQYDLGYCRGREAARRLHRNDKTHIRNVNSRNSSKELRRALAADRGDRPDRDKTCDPGRFIERLMVPPAAAARSSTSTASPE